MISINNKTWDKVEITDINNVLAGADGENFFFEFKKDDVSTEKFIKEVSAFANTYGGYILLGISDDKTISGCQNWTEEKIHTTIHDSITPTPVFDIKEMDSQGKTIFVIKVEQGSMPPYITNKGKIYERLASGSYTVNTSDKLSQMYYKREEHLKRIENKLAVTPLVADTNTPSNIFGCIDMGFSISTSEITDFQKNFFTYDFTKVSDLIKETFSETFSDFSISQVGYSCLISLGKPQAKKGSEEVPLKAGLNNFIEIMMDGSVKARVLLIADSGTSNVDINLTVLFSSIFKKIYSVIFGNHLSDIFLSGLKYEKLTVLNQFTPYYNFSEEDDEKEIYKDYLSRHIAKYGNNIIIDGNRIPKNGLITIDRRLFEESDVEFNYDNLLRELFRIEHYNLGYIDPPEEDKK